MKIRSLYDCHTMKIIEYCFVYLHIDFKLAVFSLSLRVSKFICCTCCELWVFQYKNIIYMH